MPQSTKCTFLPATFQARCLKDCHQQTRLKKVNQHAAATGLLKCICVTKCCRFTCKLRDSNEKLFSGLSWCNISKRPA